MKIKKLVLRRETIRQVTIAVAFADATNSSQARHCSCEQHCEQIKPR